ncbi:Repair protein Rad1/Rec1/Rad17 [Penicillium capsulatum]|uniref:Repair protein Rad1/Rec1/Rad17 n=1 Tax=Penicillium capsulatum TaxID=69766 RepID=A0A9W9LZN0_9EURO|nr:Repair protein Rad1/Rec1/Rad17 [Penicillium capsulatum]KAJ6129778.1 Repair protein Rad1/Rec1/Rad17 [Penicillium capsulatum]
MPPLFTGVSNNAHHLYTLLSCIGFASRATVQITPDRLQFSVEEGRVIQGVAILQKSLFTSYTFNVDNNQDTTDQDDHDEIEYPHFVVSLTSLLETLKIFGINDLSDSNGARDTSLPQTNPASSAFNAPSLLMDRSCTLQYIEHGAPLSIIISEPGVQTTCELVTYEPEDHESEIPLQRDAIIMKIIMRSAWLHNAIAELDSSTPPILKLSASAKEKPYFALSGTGGPFSESTVEFSIDHHNEIVGGATQTEHAVQTHKVAVNDGSSRARATRTKLAPTVAETFLVSPPSSMGDRIRQSYRFALIRKAARAMAVANKVCIRGDQQGVLSLQFMIDLDDPSSAPGRSVGAGVKSHPDPCFIDFRFVPFVDDEDAERDV